MSAARSITTCAGGPRASRRAAWPPIAAALLLVLMLLVAAGAQARTRAWLDRDSVAVGDAVTLNIETDQAGASPDYAPLRAQFQLSDESASRQMQMVNGRTSIRSLFGVVLRARQAGEMTLPALRVGNEATTPLRLTVLAGATVDSAQQMQGNEVVFVQTRVDDAQPYVQQSVGVTVRLFFATQLASGELVLDTPEGASLQRVGDDASSVQAVNGRQYNVVERRFLLVPERSGALTLPAARFNGRAVGGFFDDYFGRGNGELSARSAPTTLQVRAQPANAPQPWLPLRDLRLRYTVAPQQARAGEAVQLVVEAVASGATRAQFPELPVPSVPDAQVFAEPAQHDERFVDGSPQLTLTRRYSIVPNRAGTLLVPGLVQPWWDVANAAPREARLPDQTLEVAPGSGGFAAPAPVDAPASSSPDAVVPPAPVSAGGGLVTALGTAGAWPWIALSLLLALGWALTAVMLLRRRRGSDQNVAVQAGPRTSSRYGLPDLRRALDAEGFDEVLRILSAMAGVDGLEPLLRRLDDASQRAALERMQRARWSGEGGDVASARQALREAFRDGPRWRAVAGNPEPDLAPLYPRR